MTAGQQEIDRPNALRRAAAWRAGVAALALLCVAIAPAHAQMGGPGRRGPSQEQPQRAPKQSAVPPGPVVIPQVWPRLDEGALLCKSRDDLVKYQKLTGSGGGTAGLAGCRLISKQLGIQIVDRDGPSRTQIVTTDDAKESGWTNAYLPSTPPATPNQGASTKK